MSASPGLKRNNPKPIVGKNPTFPLEIGVVCWIDLLSFFVDLTIFERPLPQWIDLGPEFSWSNARLNMRGNFAEVIEIAQRKHLEGGPIGIRDGVQVAQELANDPDVLHALRTAEKP
jgi:hypothetical protein